MSGQSQREEAMTDIHCHILPASDDGAENMAEALAMARMAEDCGVETIIATPHCGIPGAEQNNFISRELYDRFVAFKEALGAAGIGVRLKAGAEIFCTEETPRLLREGRLLTLASSDYLLTEFYFDMPGAYMDHLLARIAAEGVCPVVAHPERYEAVQRDPEIAVNWRRAGYALQMNKGSVLGRFGRAAAQTSFRLLQEGAFQLVASDAHGVYSRTTDMTDIRFFLEDYFSEEYARGLLAENPRRVLENKPLLEPFRWMGTEDGEKL